MVQALRALVVNGGAPERYVGALGHNRGVYFSIGLGGLSLGIAAACRTPCVKTCVTLLHYIVERAQIRVFAVDNVIVMLSEVIGPRRRRWAMCLPIGNDTYSR